MDLSLIVIAIGGFLAAFVNAAFATGGVYILLAASLSVLPVGAAIALQSPFSTISLLSRIVLFWPHIQWHYVLYFVFGCCFGVTLGAVAFANFPEDYLMLVLGVLLMVLTWARPSPKLTLKPRGFVGVGLAHSIFGTMFGVGGILQPVILRTPLVKGQITGTLAAAKISLDVLKITSYIQVGFDYRDYVAHILVASITSVLGSWAGKKLSPNISEALFRRVFRWLVTLLGVRLIIGGMMNIYAMV